MKLLVNSEVCSISNLSFTESLNNYYSIVTFWTPMIIKQRKVVLSSDKTTDLYILRYVFENSGYKYIAVPTNTYKLINSVTKPYCGVSTVNNLLNRQLGFKINSKFDSIPTYWVVPQSKLITVIKLISEYGKYPNGGGVKVFVDSNGLIKVVDLKRSYSFESVRNISGTVVSDKTTLDWCIKTPGIINLSRYSLDGVTTEKIQIKDGFGIGSAEVLDSSENYYECFKQSLLNEFYRNYFSSREVVVSNPAVKDLELGSVFSINGSGKFILMGYTVDYPLNPNTVVNLNLNLCSCPE